MKVYIAASDPLKAYGLMRLIETQTACKITASWIEKGMTAVPGKQTSEQKHKSVVNNFEDIKACDVLILITDHDPVPGGKWVDFGYAIMCGKRIVIVGGKHENRYTYYGPVEHVATPQELITLLSAG